MAVRIRMKKMGRRHRPFFRVCAMDQHAPRDGKVIEELGYYDPMVKETDARAVLKGERIDYWLGVGAQPSEKVKTLIKKYGTNGTHLEQQRTALERVAVKPSAPAPVAVSLPQKEETAAEVPAKPVGGSEEPETAAQAETSAESTDVAAEDGEKPSE